MIEKPLIEKFVGKKITFAWLNNDKRLFSTGILKSVGNSCILVEYQGRLQVYDLNALISVREGNENRRASSGDEL
jgi:hypothetical protein